LLTKKGLAIPTKGFLRIKKKLPYLEKKKVRSHKIKECVPLKCQN
jgi:hypothetical protein